MGNRADKDRFGVFLGGGAFALPIFLPRGGVFRLLRCIVPAHCPHAVIGTGRGVLDVEHLVTPARGPEE